MDYILNYGTQSMSYVITDDGGLFDYSVKPGQDFSKSRLGLVRLVTRSAKDRFGQVGD